VGAYAESRHRVAERLNLYAGIRLDVLDVSRDDTDDSGASYAEISPRVGINFAISRNRISPGHVYASVARSFKAPTLDQLYDVREFPAGQGAVSISNPDLQPQTADAIEVGVLQRFPLWSDAFAELDLALYRISVDDEIDFDLSTFRFGNIQESRHDGLELSFTARLLRWISVRHSSTFMRVVFRSGKLAGNRLKNIPRNSLATAVFLSPFPTVQFSLTHRHTGSLALDDGNSHEISAYDRFGARADWSRGRLAIYLSANNLFDRQASSLGFLSFNPATGQQVPFVYPIGGRAVRLGVSVSGS
jgi:outer membrane receptor protein involved in Fe transport